MDIQNKIQTVFEEPKGIPGHGNIVSGLDDLPQFANLLSGYKDLITRFRFEVQTEMGYKTAPRDKFRLRKPDPDFGDYYIQVDCDPYLVTCKKGNGNVLEVRIIAQRDDETKWDPFSRQEINKRIRKSYVNEFGKTFGWDKPVLLHEFADLFISEEYDEVQWEKLIAKIQPAIDRDRATWGAHNQFVANEAEKKRRAELVAEATAASQEEIALAYRAKKERAAK